MSRRYAVRRIRIQGFGSVVNLRPRAGQVVRGFVLREGMFVAFCGKMREESFLVDNRGCVCRITGRRERFLML
jgi:hypothetical protein